MMVAARVKPSTTTPTQSSLTSLRVEEMWARPWMVEELRKWFTEVSSPDITRPEKGDYFEQTEDYFEVGHTSVSDPTQIAFHPAFNCYVQFRAYKTRRYLTLSVQNQTLRV